ncbi:hypothetical protein BDZ97DRAFT_1780925 [Flammula alnicola]|nr:hypothetical protein BDZ97DRAFT_1780925 [Flammula alnicola]
MATRQSGIPGPGRASGIPTPGRSRSSSNVYQTKPTTPDDISRAFADAIKANDPSQHRIIPPSNIASTTSLSPQSVTYSSSGRRSVVGRPSSSASSSSAMIQERAKTPTSARISSRPPSRQSELLGKSPRTFEVGDNVRIESLGFEGVLRYVGEIDGKPGLWAGVELGGGFSGKGKNDGTVGGKQYFSCPDKCGVFVATTKLSPPTVGPGSIQRPSSVASSKGGRMTPAHSGRTTPSFFSTSRTPSASFSNGRVTPSAGSRATPLLLSGRQTPSSNPITPTANMRPRPFKTPTSKPNGISLSEKITAGSRASKYMTMTAQQLSSRDRETGADSPTRRSSDRLGLSPTISRTLSSPTRLPASPFSTPKATNGRPSNIGASPSLPSTRSRPSVNTPRARLPSGVAMPPPPSPKPLQIHSSTMNDNAPSLLPNFESQGKATGDKSSATSSSFSSSRPGSEASLRSAGTDELSILEQLQSRLDAVEYENERLRTASIIEPGAPSVAQEEELEQRRLEQKEAIDRTSNLENKLSELESRLKSQASQVESLESETERLTSELNDARSESQRSIAAHQSESETHSLEVKSFQEKLDELDRLNSQKEEINEANTLKIKQLEANLDQSCIDMEEERRELMAQIDELRVAGQETIALYEERLSAANSQRYELEYRISSLESSLKSLATEERPQEHVASSATQIDNETLRDQVQHLQKKSAKLEEQLEETRATLERDVSTYQDKISRIRLDDEQRKRDLSFKTREVEQLLKSEASARHRVEEIEEALRESTVALENARGEVEVLRAELANLDILIDDTSEGDISSKLISFTKRTSADKAQYQQEISDLQQQLQDSRAENESLLKGNTSSPSKTSDSLQETVNSLTIENNELREQIAHLEDRLSALTQTLDTRTNELEAARKKRTAMRQSLPDPSTVREEVAGLKHIVQELQKENLALAQRIKILESENQLLSSEAEQLRQEVHILEDNLDNSLHEANSTANITPQLAEQGMRSETESEQVRKRLSEMEMKHARTVHGLNKEISELEALVESKDELEQEVERLKEKLSRHKKTSKNGNEIVDGRHRLSTASSSTASSENPRGEEVCEICERPGHDIFNCSLLKDDGGGQVVCEDCESPGHDVFEDKYILWK